MSHHSDEQQLTTSSDSFWEPGNYKRTTRRLDDGHRLCGELQALVAERADIEKAYAKSLRGWAKKWSDLIEKGPEYGTTEAAWKGALVEAERLCELHLRVRDTLVNDVMQQIKNWQKDTYHKSMIQLKERKEMDEAFKKAQKPWAKLLQKVERAKLEYHAACKQERTAQNQERNATGDSSFSPDQVKKMAERVSKCRDEVSRCRDKYVAALAELSAYNPRYVEDMGGVFDRCQAMEAQRLLFFKEVLFGLHKSLNITNDPLLLQIYEEFYHTINNADHQKDLKWWANNHGVNMPMAWPQFEEYTEEFRDIAKGAKSKESLPSGPITLLHQRPVGEELPELPPPGAANNKPATSSRPTSAAPPPVNHTDIDKKTISAPIAVTNGTTGTKPNTSPSKESAGSGGGGSGKGVDNPFDEEEWDEEDGGALQDTGEPGVPVRALYDYTGAESDELTFRQGDLFEKLEDEDEQGWSKGRKDGRVGLYPANYVEPVGHLH